MAMPSLSRPKHQRVTAEGTDHSVYPKPLNEQGPAVMAVV